MGSRSSLPYLFLTVAHLHPEIAANDDWKDFVQRRVEETKTTGTISRVKSISGGSKGRLSRSKSILSRQIDPSDEDSWSKYSDAGHKELERRASMDKGGPTERHMITVAELEKLEALIKEGALERQGRPLSGEGVETLEAIPPLAADALPPAEDIPPLMPMKGTLRRTAHTSMRNVRRGAGRPSARRSSEPKKGSRISQESASEEDGATRLIESSTISPTSPPYERGEFILDGAADSQFAPAGVDNVRTSAPAVLGQLDLRNLPTPTLGIVQSPDPILDDEVVLGQVQPRQLRRPPLRRQTLDAPESLSPKPPLTDKRVTGQTTKKITDKRVTRQTTKKISCITFLPSSSSSYTTTTTTSRIRSSGSRKRTSSSSNATIPTYSISTIVRTL